MGSVVLMLKITSMNFRCVLNIKIISVDKFAKICIFSWLGKPFGLLEIARALFSEIRVSKESGNGKSAGRY